jgi:murein DD-endopeptidase MepM/ murein hydrolase activator NlpD
MDARLMRLRASVFVALALVATACTPAAFVHAPVHASAKREPALPLPIDEARPIELPLRLPVDGTWIVSQGYHGAETHRGYAAYALDLVKLDGDGRAYARRGRRTQDWYGFGAEVLASADGVVVRAIDRFPDNRVWGKGKDANTVIVRHDGVLSEYVHLQQGSLRVQVGDHVTRGQVLARCGSSGAQTPHLHWALLSSLEPIRTKPASFAHYEVLDDGGTWRAATGIPTSGQKIRHP